MTDHFYTTASNGELAPSFGYQFDGTTCHVLLNPISGAVPLYRSFNMDIFDHFYTLDPNIEGAEPYGYKKEGIAGYVFDKPRLQTIPLYRWYHPGLYDHFYTIYPSGEGASGLGYKSEGIACYVYQYPINGAVPFYRWKYSGLMGNFSFDPAISAEHKAKIMERHSFALFRAKQSSFLSAKEKSDLESAYQKFIWHGINIHPKSNSSAEVGGSKIWINFNRLIPRGNQEIAQSLIHEMMHIAGYTHPEKTSQDRPGDNGPYYGSPPLRAELCIAGTQN